MESQCPTRQNQSRLPVRLVLWGLLLALSALAIGSAAALRTSREIAVSKQLEEYHRRSAVSTTSWQQLVRLFRANRPPGKALTPEDLSTLINAGDPLEPATTDEGPAYRWSDPGSDLVVLLEFDNKAQWIGYRSLPGRTSLPPPPPDTGYQKALARLVDVSAGLFTLWLWVPLWIVFMFRMGIAPLNRRTLWMELFLAASIACFVGRWLDLAWPFRTSGVITPEGLTYVLIFFTCTTLFYRFARDWFDAFRRRPRLPLCHNCRYDLTGNVSGICPECGEPVEVFVPPAQRTARGSQPAGLD